MLEELEQICSVCDAGSMLASAKSYYDLRELDRVHLEWFCTKLQESGRYTAVILDVGAGVFADPELLYCCDRLLVPVVSGEKETQVIHNMETALECMGHRMLVEQMEYLDLPDFRKDTMQYQKAVADLIGQ